MALDQGLIEVLLTIAVGFSSLTFWFIRQTISRLSEQIVDLERKFEQNDSENAACFKSIQIEVALLRRDLDHLISDFEKN